MFTLIFIDDESIIRDGVRECINWEQNGFKLTGVFENGQEALAFIEQEHVDVVISDINMPKMDGLTFSSIVAEKYPRVIVILLTGYEQFEYAQKAIKYKVTDFLLKPITAEELAKVLGKIRSELSVRKEKERQQELLKEKLMLSFPLLKERFLNNLVSGKIDNETVELRKDFFQWKDYGAVYQVIAVILPRNCEELDYFEILDFMNAQQNDADEVFMDQEGIIIMLLQSENREKSIAKTKTFAEKVFLYAGELSLESIYIGYGVPVTEAGRISDSYRGASAASRYAKLMGFSQIISARDIQNRGRPSAAEFYSLEKIFFKELKEGSRIDAQEALKKIFTFLKNYIKTGEEAVHFYIHIQGTMYTFLNEMGLFSSLIDLQSLPSGGFETLFEAQQYFLKQIDVIEDMIRNSRNDIVHERIIKAKNVIARRYSDKNFSLSDMCDELYLSTSQFSVVFKEGTGMTFIEYLTTFRIEQAKKLLRTTDKKSYEIAEETGYADPRYFSIIFKKYTGVTPMEYRKESEQ